MAYSVFSTLTNDQHYADYDRPADKNLLPTVKSKIFIKGGTGVSNKHFITPQGVVTKVSDEEYAILQTNLQFMEHVKGGFIKVEKREHAPEKVARDMAKDKSAPRTPGDYTSNKEDAPKPVIGKSKKAA